MPPNISILFEPGSISPTEIQRGLQASMARRDHDKIYGAHGVLLQLGIVMPEPDYSLPVEQVYMGATVALIQHTKSLYLLTSASFSQNGDIPSWSMDLRLPLYKYVATSTWSSFIEHHGRALPKSNFSVYGSLLAAEGLNLGRVQQTTNSLPDLFFSEVPISESILTINIIRQWTRICSLEASLAAFKELLRASNAFTDKNQRAWKTCMQKLVSFSDEEIANEANRIWKNQAPCPKFPGIKLFIYLMYQDPEAVRAASAILDDVLMFIPSTRLFTTANGLCCLTMHPVEVDDIVVRLQGVNIPFILRPRSLGWSHTLVGYCYAHGKMDWKTDPASEGELQTFFLGLTELICQIFSLRLL